MQIHKRDEEEVYSFLNFYSIFFYFRVKIKNAEVRQSSSEVLRLDRGGISTDLFVE